jgi:hypothetical protein
VNYHKTTKLAKYNILTPPKATVSRGYAIRYGGVSRLPVPVGNDFGREIFRRRKKHAMWLDPMYDVNSGYLPRLFREEQEAALNRFTDENPPLDAILASSGFTIKDAIKNSRRIGFIMLRKNRSLNYWYTCKSY